MSVRVERKRKSRERISDERDRTLQIDHRLLVQLWDKAVGTANYDKKQWNKLSNQIHEANSQLRELEKQQEKDGRSTDS